MTTTEITTKKTLGAEIYSQYSNEELLKAYKEGPRRIREAVSGLTEQELKARPFPGKWSIAEIVVHLADGEIIGACRFRQAYCEQPDPFPYYNEDDWAKRLAYQDKDLFEISEQLRLFSYLRKTTHAMLRSLNDNDWSKSGIHPQRGRMSIRGLLELYADHSERHLIQIIERRRLLGKPFDNDIMLPVRLY